CLLIGILIPAIRAIVRPSTLTLLVARIRADHPHDALASNDLAVSADPPHRSSYFHRSKLPAHFPAALRLIPPSARSPSGSLSSTAPRTGASSCAPEAAP